MIAILSKVRKPDRRGMVAVFVALSLTVMVAAAALTLDGGLIVSERRRAQNVADGAALAGAYQYYSAQAAGGSAAYCNLVAQSAATSAAKGNGYSNTAMIGDFTPWRLIASLPISPLPGLAVQLPGGPAPALVTAVAPPASGTFKGQAGYVQVFVTRYVPRYFTAVWWGSGTMSVSAQSVARGVRQPGAPPNAAATNMPFFTGLQLLNASGSNTLSSTGGVLSVPNGAVVIDSSNGTAASTTGTSSVTAKSISISGNYSGNFVSGGGTPTTGATALPDPFSYLTPPGSSGLASRSYSSGGATLQPGLYSSGITATSGAITLSPGIYYLGGSGLSITGTASLSGSNVLIYIDPASSSNGATLTGSGTVSLSPPTAGPYAGFTIIQNPASTAPIKITGSNNLTNNGAIYAAKAPLTLTGNGLLDVFGSVIVADRATVAGTGTISLGTGSATGVRDTRIVQ